MIKKVFFELKYEILIADLTDVGGGDFEVTLPREPDRVTTLNGMLISFSLKPGTSNTYVLESTSSQNFIAFMAFYFNDDTFMVEDKDPETPTGTLVVWEPRINQDIEVVRENKRIFQSSLSISSSNLSLINNDFGLNDIFGIKYKHINNPIKIYFDDALVFAGNIASIQNGYNQVNVTYKDGLFKLRKFPTFGDTINETIASKDFYPNIAPQHDGFAIPFYVTYHTPLVHRVTNIGISNVSPYGNIDQIYPAPEQRFVGINTNYSEVGSNTLNKTFVLCKTPAPISTSLLSFPTASFQDVSPFVLITFTVRPFGLFAGDQVRLNANVDLESVVIWVNYDDKVALCTQTSPIGLTSVDKHPFQFYFYRYGSDSGPTSISPLFESVVLNQTATTSGNNLITATMPTNQISTGECVLSYSIFTNNHIGHEPYVDKLVTGTGLIFNPVGSPGGTVAAEINRIEPDLQVGGRSQVIDAISRIGGPLGIMIGVLKDGSVLYQPASIGPSEVFEANEDNIINGSFSITTDFQDVYSELRFSNKDGVTLKEDEWQRAFTNTLVDDYYDSETEIQVDHPFKEATSAQTRSKLLTSNQSIWFNFTLPKVFVADLGDVVRVKLKGYDQKVFIISVRERRGVFSYIGQELPVDL